jgi:hypothetical protein
MLSAVNEPDDTRDEAGRRFFCGDAVAGGEVMLDEVAWED